MNARPGTRPSRDSKIQRVSAYIAAVFLGGLVGLTFTFIVIRQLGPGALPELTRKELENAKSIWQAAQIRNYDIEVIVRSRDESHYRTEVRNGSVTAVWRDHQPSTQQRTFGTWSVQGMFETIERDVGAFELGNQTSAPAGSQQLRLRGFFDPKHGFPRRYQRTEIRRFQANQESSWEVVKFEITSSDR